MINSISLCMCLQVEVCWACPQSNLVQMANGQSRSCLAILVVFVNCSHHCPFLSLLPLSPFLRTIATTATLKVSLVHFLKKSYEKYKCLYWDNTLSVTAVTLIYDLNIFSICFPSSLSDLVTDMDFSPFDESLLATCSRDETVRFHLCFFVLILLLCTDA